jgi:hypothetical protein
MASEVPTANPTPVSVKSLPSLIFLTATHTYHPAHCHCQQVNQIMIIQDGGQQFNQIE